MGASQSVGVASEQTRENERVMTPSFLPKLAKVLEERSARDLPAGTVKGAIYRNTFVVSILWIP
jgi:hypothetical protein